MQLHLFCTIYLLQDNATFLFNLKTSEPYQINFLWSFVFESCILEFRLQKLILL